MSAASSCRPTTTSPVSARPATASEDRVGARIHAEAQARGLFSRVRSDVFVLAPPFVTPDDLLDRIGEILAAATTAVLG